MAKIDPFADQLLTNWAKWAKGLWDFGLGYGSDTIEYRLMREGLLLSSPKGRPEPSNESAEIIETILLKMPRKMQKVVKIEYLVYGSRKHKQEICHLGRRIYEQFLRRGQNWVTSEYDCALLPLGNVRQNTAENSHKNKKNYNQSYPAYPRAKDPPN